MIFIVVYEYCMILHQLKSFPENISELSLSDLKRFFRLSKITRFGKF